MAQTPKKPAEPSSPGKKRFHQHVARAIAHNEKNEQKRSLHIHYKKLNGRTVKRKIDPRSMRGNTLVAYDHKRKAIRSFRMERVHHMEKAAFFVGFEKRAYSDQETELMLQHHANLPRKHPVRRALSAVAAGGAAGAALGGPAGRPGASALIGGGLGALIGGVTALGARHHNQRVDQARDTLTRGPGEREAEIAKANPDRFWSSFSKKHMEAAKSKMWDDANRTQPGPGGVDKTGGLGAHLTHGAELGGLGILAHDSIKDWNHPDPAVRSKARKEGVGLGVLALPSIHHFGSAALGALRK